MPFTDEEAQSLLAVKGIGKTILQRCSKWVWMMFHTSGSGFGRCFGTRGKIDRLDLLEKQSAG